MGICLGHQAVCEVFGAAVTHAKQLMHGKQSVALLDTDSTLFRGMKKETVVERREYPVFGVQFHPESVLTPEGSGSWRIF